MFNYVLSYYLQWKEKNKTIKSDWYRVIRVTKVVSSVSNVFIHRKIYGQSSEGVIISK